MQNWVPNLGIQEILSNANGKILNYSDYRYFLFTFFFNLFIFFGWLGWFSVKTSKPYRYAIVLPLVSISYQIVIILSAARATWLNSPYLKIFGTFAVAFFLIYKSYKKDKLTHTPITLNKKILLFWLFFFVISCLPYFHDILTLRSGDLRTFIPNFGIEEFLSHNNKVLGWNSYRVFIFIFTTHLFAQIGWAGWFFDAGNRLFRPFLLVPIVFNLYELTIITLNVNAPAFNKPDWKLYLVILLAILIAINLYFNSDKALQLMEEKSSTKS